VCLAGHEGNEKRFRNPAQHQRKRETERKNAGDYFFSSLLEDGLFVPVDKTSIDSPFYIYQVEQRRFTLVDGKVIENVPAGIFSEYVAISNDGDRVYRFAGSSNAENDFRRLISDYHLQGREADS
jgi:hypothetical protein